MHTDADIIAAASVSTSIIDFCRRLGYKSASCYPKYLKPRLDALGLIVKRLANSNNPDEAVIEAARGANSVSEVMRRLGLTTTGYAHYRFKIRLKRLGVDVESMKGSAWNRGTRTGDRRLLSDYLVLDGPFITSSALRKKLIKAGLKENICECCGQDGEWYGQPLTMQLDHRNGRRNDCRLENLWLLCPNCHTQTPTHSKIKRNLAQ